MLLSILKSGLFVVAGSNLELTRFQKIIFTFNLEACTFHLLKSSFLVPCVWGPWSEFSQCDKSCGGGKMFKTRTKVVIEQPGGYCDNLATMVKDCNTHHCPSKFQNTLMI